MKAFDQELVSGGVLRSVWKLVWPTVLLNTVNGLHGIIDHVLVGRFVVAPENAANAGIGVAWQVFMVFVVFISSLYHGMSVLIARYTGMRDREMLSEVAYTTFLASVYVLIFIAGPLGYILTPQLLALPKASEEVLAYAQPYLRILFLFGGPLFLSFMLTGAMQASGDPKLPLFLGIMSAALNLLLSIGLILGIGPLPAMGANGAALAMCLAPMASVLVALTVIYRGWTVIQRPERYHLLPDWRILKRVVTLGAYSGVQGILLNVGGVMLLHYIGSLEERTAAQAAYAICYTQVFSLVLWPSWALRNASSAIIGQNIGAGYPARGIRGVYMATLMGVGWSACMGCLYWTMPHQLLGLFGADDHAVQSFGGSLLSYLAFSGLFLSSGLSLTGALIGAGDTFSPMVIALVTQIAVLLGVCQIFVWSGALSAEAIWMAILISHATRMVLTLAVFHRGRWKRLKVELG